MPPEGAAVCADPPRASFGQPCPPEPDRYVNHRLATPFPLPAAAAPDVLCRPIPWRDPVEAFAAIRHRSRPVLLDSALVDGDAGPLVAGRGRPVPLGRGRGRGGAGRSLRRHRRPRWTAIGSSPIRSCRRSGPARSASWATRPGGSPTACRLPPPVGLDLPDIAFGLYDCVAVFDAVERRAWVLSTGWPEEDPVARRHWAQAQADDLAAAIAGAPPLPPPDATPRGVWQSEMPADGYRDGVRRIRDWITAGDIYQANLTQRFLADLPDGLDPFDAVPPPARPVAGALRRLPRPRRGALDRQRLAGAVPGGRRRPARRDPADQGHPPARRPTPTRTRALAAELAGQRRRTGPRT